MGLSWFEMLIVGVVALIVIGPKELPALMQRMGKVAGTIRRMGQEFQREINKSASGLDEVKNLRSTITNPLKATADSIRKEFNATSSSGAVQPTGIIKPADPKAQSVVSEIKAAAGMTLPETGATPPATPVAKAAGVADTVKPASAATPHAVPAASPVPAAEAGPLVRAPAKTGPASSGPAVGAPETPTAGRITVKPASPSAEPVKAARPSRAKAAAPTEAAPAEAAKPVRRRTAAAPDAAAASGPEPAGKPAARRAAKPPTVN